MEPQTPCIPRVALPWRRIASDPESHFNDFCVFRDAQEHWHAIGIMGSGAWDSERSFFHYAGDTLQAPFEEQPAILTAEPDIVGELRPKSMAPQKHCPFVVHHDGRYHMFYRRPWGCMLHVVTHDPFAWPDEAEVIFEEADARDPCIVEHHGQFLMYYCRSCEIDGVPRSCVFLRESRDLRSWLPGRCVFHDAHVRAEHSFIESPFVIKRPEGWYLLYRDRTGSDTDTPVLYSNRFDRFEDPPVASLIDCHAAEAVTHEDMHYIFRVSGAFHGHPGAPSRGAWLDVAPLRFLPKD